jgi:predicted outer membrane repeat protein
MFVGNNSTNKTGTKLDSGGGGIEAGYYFQETYAPINNTVSIVSCCFEENYADFGGGTLLFSSYAFRKDINNSFYLIGCLWKKNSAIFGAAVDLTSKLTVHSHPPHGILPIPVFTNCNFEMNRIVNIDGRRGIGKGTFISTDMSAHFNGTTLFDNSNGSAIHMTSGFLRFDEHSYVTFTNNNGSIGGAIGLVGRSSVLVQDHSRFFFINNSAILNGGAISYFTTDRHSFASFRNCFIEYIGQTSEVNERDIEFQFEGNTATVGSSIHASTVAHCSRPHSTATDPTNMFNYIANFSFPKNDVDSATYQLTTSGVRFNINYSLLPLQVIPGKTFDLPIVMVDEFNHTVPSLYILKIYSNSTSFIPPNYARLFNTTRTKIYGNPGDHVELMVFHKAGLQERELKFKVSLQNCPPGYVIDQKSNDIPYNTCYCSYGIYVGMSCNYSNFQAKLLRGYWVGYDRGDRISENSLITGYCPEGYCNQASNTEYLLPSNTSKSELDQQVCVTGRTGILCGRCSDNYSVYYHGWILRCLDNSNCSYGPVLYILLELLPITFVFVIIIFFDVPITSGAANGFVLFCQVIDTLQLQANRFIWIPVPDYILNTISIRFIYKIFSLQFFTANDIERLKFLSFCLWKGSTGLAILAFHYVTLLYSLLLVIVTVKVMDMCNIRKYCCECCFKLRRKQTVRGSITHGLTTFLLLCYSRFTQVSLMILIPGTLYSKHGTVTRQVVFYDGEVDFLSKQHLFYAVPALAVSGVLFLLPLLLTLYPACYNVFSALGIGESRLLRIFCKVISIENLKPILDSFQGCFKDRFRFFAGLYFFYRLFALITFAYTSNLRVFYMIVEVQLVLMLMVHALVQPYKRRWHNAIDAMLFAILALINALTTFNFGRSFSRNNSKDINVISSIQAFLICLPGIYMLFYVIGYILTDVCGLRLKLKCCIDMKTVVKQAILPKCRQYFKKRNTTGDSAVELQSFYYSYED